MLVKGEIQNGVISVLQAMDRATALQAKDILWEHHQSPGSRRISSSKADVWATIRKYMMHGTLSHLLGSGRHFKLMPDILAIIEEQMRADDETTATQLAKL